MIFENEAIAFQILDVIYIDQMNIRISNHGRNFDALSFRFCADTIIECNGVQTEFTDNTMGYFPSGTDYTRISKRDKMIVIHFKTFNYHSNEIEYIKPENPQKYAELFKEIHNCWNRKDVSYMHISSAILNKIFAELYGDNKKAYNSISKIGASLEYIEENCYKNDLSLKFAAEKSYISDTYFRKLFKEEFGISPKQYIIHKRIKYAASLIISGYYSLETISDMCGYNDYKHFSVEFKRVTGVSPSKYIYNYQ